MADENLTPKEKANDIVQKIFNEQHIDDRAKMICISTVKIALLFVDEIIKSQPNNCGECGVGNKEYWQEVKQELEKM